MRQVAIVGAGMTRFAKHLDRSMKDLTREAVDACLASSGVDKNRLEAAAVGNAMAGLLTGQECIRGQVVLCDMGIGGIPVINTEKCLRQRGHRLSSGLAVRGLRPVRHRPGRWHGKAVSPRQEPFVCRPG